MFRQNGSERLGISCPPEHFWIDVTIIETVREQKHNIGFGFRKYLFVKQHKLDIVKPLEKKLPYRSCVVDTQQLGGQH